MPDFQIRLRQMTTSLPSELGIECRDLEQAYLEVCAAIPDMAQDMLVAGRNPMACVVDIHDKMGRLLMQVPFAEVLPSPAWRIRRARRRPHGGIRSDTARENLALGQFRQMFGSIAVGCTLLTPDLNFVDVNEAYARNNSMDFEAVRGNYFFDVFGDVTKDVMLTCENFFSLAQAGAVSEIVDLPYVMADGAGQMTQGWWSGRVWPIYDDDDAMLGLVAWAEPGLRPKAGGKTIIRVASASTP